MISLLISCSVLITPAKIKLFKNNQQQDSGISPGADRGRNGLFAKHATLNGDPLRFKELLLKRKYPAVDEMEVLYYSVYHINYLKGHGLYL